VVELALHYLGWLQSQKHSLPLSASKYINSNYILNNDHKYQSAAQSTAITLKDKLNFIFPSNESLHSFSIDYYKLMASINPDSIWVFSALDKLMIDYKNKAETFTALFEKKKTMIELLQSMKIDAKKYKALVAKAYKEDSGDIKKCAETDLLKCKDGKSEEMVELWFREMIENTGAFY
jgi:hypothetical protein